MVASRGPVGGAFRVVGAQGADGGGMPTTLMVLALRVCNFGTIQVMAPYSCVP